MAHEYRSGKQKQQLLICRRIAQSEIEEENERKGKLIFFGEISFSFVAQLDGCRMFKVPRN